MKYSNSSIYILTVWISKFLPPLFAYFIYHSGQALFNSSKVYNTCVYVKPNQWILKKIYFVQDQEENQSLPEHAPCGNPPLSNARQATAEGQGSCKT